MNFNRNENLKIVGFFGQSGSGKTTIIRNVDKRVNNQAIIQNTGIVRYLFKKNNSYQDPINIIAESKQEKDNAQEKDNTQETDKTIGVYERYIRSQMQLLNDWSTEVFLLTQEVYPEPSILLLDRSPIDFYVMTVCGINTLIDEFGKKLSPMDEHFLKLNKQIAEDNTNNFFNAIFVTKPWGDSNINTLRDGIRDQYLSEKYTGDVWYEQYDKIKLIKDIKTFVIGEDIIDLNERAKLVNEKLTEI